MFQQPKFVAYIRDRLALKGKPYPVKFEKFMPAVAYAKNIGQ